MLCDKIYSEKASNYASWFLLGPAYLEGIGVERNFNLGVRMITDIASDDCIYTEVQENVQMQAIEKLQTFFSVKKNKEYNPISAEYWHQESLRLLRERIKKSAINVEKSYVDIVCHLFHLAECYEMHILAEELSFWDR